MLALVIADNGIVHLLADKHGRIVQRTGKNRPQGPADLRPAGHSPEVPGGGLTQIDAQHGQLQGLHALQCFDTGTVVLQITGNAELPVVAQIRQGLACLIGISFFEQRNDICTQMQHIIQRLLDDPIQGEDDEQGQERPQASTEGACAFFPIELLHSLLITGLIVTVGQLQLLHLGL